MPFNTKDGEQWTTKYQFIPGIALYLRRAEELELASRNRISYKTLLRDENSTDWADFITGLPVAAKAIVTVRNLDGAVLKEVEETVMFSEFAKYTYNKTTKKQELNSKWKSSPSLMIQKCALAMAYRRGFPTINMGYTYEELPAEVVVDKTVKTPDTKREQWLEERKRYISTTDVVGKLDKLKRPKGTGSSKTNAAELGHAAEPKAIDYVNANYCKKGQVAYHWDNCQIISRNGKYAYSPDGFIGLKQPKDAVTITFYEFTKLCEEQEVDILDLIPIEIKTYQRTNHEFLNGCMENNAQSKELYQLAWAMMLTGTEACIMVNYGGYELTDNDYAYTTEKETVIKQFNTADLSDHIDDIKEHLAKGD